MIEEAADLSVKAADKSAHAVSIAILKALGPYRKQSHTLTYDNGKEFAMHQLIDEILETTSFFAHPYHHGSEDSMKTPTASFANTSPSEPTSAKPPMSKFTNSKRNSITAQENTLAGAPEVKYS